VKIIAWRGASTGALLVSWLAALTSCSAGAGEDEQSTADASTGGCYGDGSNDRQQGAANATDGCHEWQRAVCDWTERCGGDAVRCREQAPAISCLCDAHAYRCSTDIDAAACSDAPPNCDLAQIADPEPAIAACNVLLAAVCDRAEECQASTREGCMTETSATLDCTLAVAVMPQYEQCLGEISQLSCDLETPVSCQRVILLF
jgi:hypothetical protein